MQVNFRAQSYNQKHQLTVILIIKIQCDYQYLIFSAQRISPEFLSFVA
jgi:hypothetical protein